MKKAAALALSLAMACLPCSLASAGRSGLSDELFGKVSALPEWADGRLSLRTRDGEAILTYGESERYVFADSGAGYRLKEAAVGSFRMAAAETDWGSECYEASEGGERAVWMRPIGLDGFEIDLFPRSVEEVRHLNFMLAALNSGAQAMVWSLSDGPGAHYSGVGKGTAPVYSAPFGDSAWRAAEGKAAVGLKGEFWVLGAFVPEEGEPYVCIRYDIGERMQRIGYVRAADIGYSCGEQESGFINVDVVAIADTDLTDDPDVSRCPQIHVPEGTQLTCIALYNDQYAYVSGEVRKGRFADGGAIVWGFVPLRDLAIDPNGNHAPVACEEAAARLIGAWTYYAGGSQAQDELIFNPDGTYTGITTFENRRLIDTGTWSVSAYNPACRLYWNEPRYELTLRDADGTANVRGLSFEEGEEAFSLTDWEGSGGYQRAGEGEEGE